MTVRASPPEAPELAQAVTQGRRKNHRPRMLAGLLRCYCGGPMSPGTGGGLPGYYCGRGQRGNHARPHYISESKLMSSIVAEAEGLVGAPAQYEQAEGGYDDSPERAALEALRGKVADAIIDAGLADLDEKRAERGEHLHRVVNVPPRINWDHWEPAAINEVARAMWDYVQLGPDLLPERYERSVPEWWA